MFYVGVLKLVCQGSEMVKGRTVSNFESLDYLCYNLLLKYYLMESVMTVLLKETTSIKLDKQAKENAKVIFKELGITMGDAFNMFLSQVNLHKGIPFEVKIPNSTSKKTIKEARQGKNIAEFTVDELHED